MTTNVAASVRARLANKARESQRPFQEVLQYYGLERFLYRFSRTEHCPRFVLKGVRIRFTGFLERARIPMQLDIGFGDVVHPRAQEMSYPTILDFPAPRLRMYPRETVVAEKLEAMVYLGSVNSRMKDFFDIWLLARQFDFSGAELAASIAKTFANRETELDADPVALKTAFTTAQTTSNQWSAFIRRSNLDSATATLEEIREPLRQFLIPVITAIAERREFTGSWTAGGPWHTGS